VNEGLFYNFRCGFDNDRNIILLNKINGEKLEIKKPRGRTRIENYIDYTEAEKTSIYNWFFDLKKDLLQNDGVLHFDDAYFLSHLYLKQYSNSKKILQFRFEYIFVDEMQDMDIHQYNLLEILFFNNNDSHSIIQRIGDINQAIFNGFSDSENVWKFRENLKYLQGSHRLNPRIASIVEKLALTPNLIEGKQVNPDNTQIEIKPILIIYTNDSKENVLNVFASKIEELISNSSIPSSELNNYKALAWRKEHPDVSKIGLKDYWLQYNDKSFKTKIDYQCLEEYLIHFDKEKQTFEDIRKNILNSFLRIFRLENIVDEDNKPYTKRKLINYLKNLENNEYEDFKLNIYDWSFNIIKNDLTVCNNIREYIPILLNYFQKVVDLSNDFINSNENDVIEQVEIENNSNKFTQNNIEIEVGTVHSAKGQTHTATLYLETFFQRGYGNYESERLRNQFLGTNVSETLNTNITSKEKIKKSAKMTYVGFSRPTHLLSVAIHKDRFDSCLTDIDRDIWDIIEI
jgi:DNA helicase-2/ATP-dependent DNA helicase PcrA